MNFKKWIEKQLKSKIPEEVIAFNFNLYETDDENSYDVQLVGCDSYDRENEDWACEVIYSSEEDIYTFEADGWEAALEDFIACVNSYLEECKPDNRLKMAEYITAGFVDGDLEVIFDKDAD